MLATVLTIAAVALTPLHSNHQPFPVPYAIKPATVAQAKGHPHKDHPKPKHHQVHLGPMDVVAAQHGWDSGQVADAWKILFMESTSTPGDVQIWKVNPYSGCVGAAQFLSWGQYYTYGGDPKTVQGQLVAFGNYVAGRYGTPANALAFHYEHGWY